jgi:hypothetical protein
MYILCAESLVACKLFLLMNNVVWYISSFSYYLELIISSLLIENTVSLSTDFYDIIGNIR